MRLEIACKTHPGVTLWSGEVEDHGLVEALLFRVHAGGDHAGMHEYEVLVDGHPLPQAPPAPPQSPQTVALVLALVESPAERTTYPAVPPWLVGALVVQFHASREGKAIKMWVDGREF